MKWIKVTVEKTHTCDVFVPLPDSVPPDRHEDLARLAVENCDAYGNLPDGDPDVACTDFSVAAPSPHSYVEPGVLRVLSEDQVLALAAEVTSDPDARPHLVFWSRLQWAVDRIKRAAADERVAAVAAEAAEVLSDAELFGVLGDEAAIHERKAAAARDFKVAAMHNAVAGGLRQAVDELKRRSERIAALAGRSNSH